VAIEWASGSVCDSCLSGCCFNNRRCKSSATTLDGHRRFQFVLLFQLGQAQELVDQRVQPLALRCRVSRKTESFNVRQIVFRKQFGGTANGGQRTFHFVRQVLNKASGRGSVDPRAARCADVQVIVTPRLNPHNLAVVFPQQAVVVFSGRHRGAFIVRGECPCSDTYAT
jgi:hypothetical protein